TITPNPKGSRQHHQQRQQEGEVLTVESHPPPLLTTASPTWPKPGVKSPSPCSSTALLIHAPPHHHRILLLRHSTTSGRYRACRVTVRISFRFRTLVLCILELLLLGGGHFAGAWPCLVNHFPCCFGCSGTEQLQSWSL
ncbi:hypothetical protein LINGRAHAP2_LOCUS13158, partial [Linum grandiflorum]